MRKSLLYLLAAKGLYHKIKTNKGEDGYFSKVTATDKSELESTYVHSMFYLPQAYGNIGDSKKSSVYCRETLRRQFNAGLRGSNEGEVKAAFELTKTVRESESFTSPWASIVIVQWCWVQRRKC